MASVGLKAIVAADNEVRIGLTEAFGKLGADTWAQGARAELAAVGQAAARAQASG